MREIKFRGFLEIQKRWVYGNLIVDENGKKYIVDNKLFSADGHHLAYEPTDEPVFINQDTIGQYTGMKDCNGTEIYEGDIVSTDDADIARITWDDDEYKFTVDTEEYLYDLGEFHHEDLEVIGNIYDNPELLGGADDEH